MKYLKKLIMLLDRFEQLEEKEQLDKIHLLKKIPGVKVLIKEVIEC